MKKIHINVPGKEYDVLLGTNIFSKLKTEISKRNLYKNILVLVDTKVFSAHKNIIVEFCASYKSKIELLQIKCNEELKSQETVDKIYTKLLNKGFNRDTLIVAIGGGILGDIAGYAAATFMRGIPFVQVPTTLLAAVDSSVGGKTGINFGKTKNIIGAFHQPELVLIDTNFFSSLPKVELTCGVGEIIKYAFLTDEKLYKQINKNIAALYVPGSKFQNKIIQESVIFKGNVVATDEKESGLRKILNLGHTFAHAVEIDQNHKIKHGQAVVVGIACSLHLSNRLGIISEKLLEQYLELIAFFTNDIKIKNYDLNGMFNTMLKDKKNRSGEIRFVLLKEVGNILIDITAGKQDVNYALQNGLAHFTK